MNTSHSKRDEQNRRDTILVVMLIFVCVGLFGIGSLISGDIEKGSILASLSGLETQAILENSPTPSPSPRPSATPKPTPTPVRIQTNNSSSKKSTLSAGLGIGLEEIQTVYKNEGFQFIDEKMDNDRIHSLGKTTNGLTAIELNGTMDDVREAAVVSYLVSDTPEHVKDCLYYMAQMIKTVLPAWKDGTKWLYANIGILPTLKTKPQEVETISMNVHIHLKKLDSPSLIILSMEPAPVK